MQTAKIIKVKKKCKVCKSEFVPFSSLQKACGPKCALELVRQDAQKRADNQRKKKKREFRLSDVKTQREAADRAFNKYIRYRDRNEVCISCDKPSHWDGQWAAGHFYTKGARSDLRYNEDNVHKQCNRDCNQRRSGNIGSYRPRLIAKIGQERFDALELVCKVQRRAEDYRAIAIKYRDKLRLAQSEWE